MPLHDVPTGIRLEMELGRVGRTAPGPVLGVRRDRLDGRRVTDSLDPVDLGPLGDAVVGKYESGYDAQYLEETLAALLDT